MKIDELLDKYFEGETSCEEERELRRFLYRRGSAGAPANVPPPIRLSEPGSNFNGGTDRGKIRNNRIGKGSTRHSGSLSVSIAHSMLSAALPPDCSCFSG